MKNVEPCLNTREWQPMWLFMSTTASLIGFRSGRCKFPGSSLFISLVAEFGGNNEENWTRWQKITMVFIAKFKFFLIAQIAFFFSTKHIYSVGRFVFSIISIVLLIAGFVILIWVRLIN